MKSALPPELAALHRELGIPANYGSARELEPQPEPAESELIEIGPNPDGRMVRLYSDAARAWTALREAADAAGITLVPISGHRSVARQTELIRTKLAAGATLHEVLRYMAAPGFSEHHTGRALDIGSTEHIDLDEDFARTRAFAWLEANASGFGFRMSYPAENSHGIGYEPWHWCWWPKPAEPAPMRQMHRA